MKSMSFFQKLLVGLLLVFSACKTPIKDSITSGLLQKQVPFGKVVSLNGKWQLAEGMNGQLPQNYTSEVPVPGLVQNAIPEFTEIGVESEQRNAFFYKKLVYLDNPGEGLVFLKINKAKYTTTIFINGNKAGYNPLNFTPTKINITNFIKPNEENEIVIEVGAYISNAPDSVNTCGEPEKERYIPGIYDEVSLIYTDKCFVENVQLAPDIDNGKVDVYLYVKNLGGAVNKVYNLNIFDQERDELIASKSSHKISVLANDTALVKVEIPFKDYQLWSPETPVIYNLRVDDGNNSSSHQFGMRKFRVDNRFTNTALLNNKQYFLRGTNISTFRFFEDTLCKQQVWDTAWVRRFHKKLKELNLNSYRPVVGAMPEFWYDIADEEGFIIFNEFPLWYAFQPDVSSGKIEKFKIDPFKKWSIYPSGITTSTLVNEYTQWMYEHWNHASVCAWDAQNETWTKQTGEAINLVRNLDYSNRPWDNGWSPPAGENDFRESHPYMLRYNVGSEDKLAIKLIPKPFQFSDLHNSVKLPRTFYAPYQYAYLNGKINGHWNTPCIINEYGYAWINRDGTPTELTQKYYDVVLGENATADQRFYHYARSLATMTEYWRGNRTCFGVLFPFALAHSREGGKTADIFLDIDKLKLYPYFEKYVPDAFFPLGITIPQWNESYSSGIDVDIPILLTNDFQDEKKGTFSVSVINEEDILGTNEYYFQIKALEQHRRFVKVKMPEEPGDYMIKAELSVENNTITCYRDIVVKKTM